MARPPEALKPGTGDDAAPAGRRRPGGAGGHPRRQICTVTRRQIRLVVARRAYFLFLVLSSLVRFTEQIMPLLVVSLMPRKFRPSNSRSARRRGALSWRPGFPARTR